MARLTWRRFYLKTLRLGIQILSSEGHLEEDFSYGSFSFQVFGSLDQALCEGSPIGYSFYQSIKKFNKSRNYVICIILIRNLTWTVLIGDIIWLVFVLYSVLFDLSTYHNKVFVICGQYGLGYNSIRDSRITSIIGPVYNSMFVSIWTRIIIPYPKY